MDIPATMLQVERALVESGHDAAGYSALPAPVVVLVDGLPGGDWGSYELGTIRISRSQPGGCLIVTLRHELAHDATIRMGLLGEGDAFALKAEMERIANRVEVLTGLKGDWVPNCGGVR